MGFFYRFTESLKQKWLHFFQVNREWIKLHMEVESVYTPDGGKRPPSYLILGVVNALEPKLAQLMLPFSKLNPDADTLIEVLGLNFDPDYALGLGNCLIPKQESCQNTGESGKTDDETLTVPPVNDLESATSAEDLGMTYDHEETLMVSDTTTVRDELRAAAIAEAAKPVQSEELSQTSEEDEFGDISFDELNEIGSQISSATVAPGTNDFTEVLSDVWGEETTSSSSAVPTGESNTDIFIGEELTSNAFDESEIARFFPNR
jgi:hypothetical protein